MLFWIEALSLLKSVDVALTSFEAAKQWSQVSIHVYHMPSYI